MYNLGVTQWFLDVEPVDSVLRAHDLGFSYLHINSFGPTDEFYIGKQEVLNKYKTQIDATKITIAGISLSAYEVYGIPRSFDNFQEDILYKVIIDTIHAAKTLNVDLIYLPSFNRGQIKSINDLEATAQLLNIICSIAKEQKFYIASENTLNVNDNQNLISKCKEMFILLDTQNPLMYDNSIEQIINKLADKLAPQVHVKDGDSKTLGNARLGEGNCDLRKTLTLLRQLKREFIYIFENDYRSNAVAKVQEDILNFASIMKSIDYE